MEFGMSLAVSALLSFVLSFLLTKKWIEFARERGIVGKDVNKYGFPEVPEAGGIAVVLSIYISLILFLLLYRKFTFEILSLILVMVCGGAMGILDDFLGWKKGLSQEIKPVLMYLAGLSFAPIGYFAAKSSSLGFLLDFFPKKEWVYSVFFVPVGVMGASNAINLYAGYDGLLPGSLAIIFGAVALKAYLEGQILIFSVSLIALSSVLAFFYYNWYPARVFPGNVFPFALGALFAGLVVLGGMELFGIFLILPHFVETALHARKRFKVENFGIPQPDGTIKPRYDKIYSLAHALHRVPGMTERKITGILLGLQIISACIAFILF